MKSRVDALNDWLITVTEFNTGRKCVSLAMGKNVPQFTAFINTVQYRSLISHGNYHAVEDKAQYHDTYNVNHYWFKASINCLSRILLALPEFDKPYYDIEQGSSLFEIPSWMSY